MPIVAGAVASACTTDNNTDVGGGDASFCTSVTVCADGGTDAPVPQANDAAADRATPVDATPTSDVATLDAATDAASPTDAADASDAPSFADVDQTCSDYATQVGSTPVSVRIVNQRDSGIYLGHTSYSCSQGVPFTLTDSTSTPLAVTHDNATLTCADLQVECPGAPQCDGLYVTKVAPGGTSDTGWTGTYFQAEPMPPQCYLDAGCSALTCIQETPAAGTYTIAATVYSQALCGDASAPVPCTADCSSGTTGVCIVPGSIFAGGAATTISATWISGQKVLVLDVP